MELEETKKKNSWKVTLTVAAAVMLLFIGWYFLSVPVVHNEGRNPSPGNAQSSRSSRENLPPSKQLEALHSELRTMDMPSVDDTLESGNSSD